MSEFYPDIWRLQAQGDIRGLIEAVKHASPDVRRHAAAALRALGASSAIPALQAALVNEHEADVRSAFILTLDSLFQQEVDEDSDSGDEQYAQVVRLIAQLSSRQPDRIIRAARRLGELKEKIAAESLILVFHNRELPGRVRLAAAEALLQLESAPIEVSLLGALRHSDGRVRRNAIAVLGQFDADWAVEPLSQALKDPNDLIQRTAQAALKRIGTPEALIALAATVIPEPPAASPAPAKPAAEPPATSVPAAAPPAATPAKPAAEAPLPPPSTPAAATASPAAETKAESVPPAPVEAPQPMPLLDVGSVTPPTLAALGPMPQPDEEDTQPTLPVS